jgi:RNA polymerase sigma factor (sigma-70 family)
MISFNDLVEDFYINNFNKQVKMISHFVGGRENAEDVVQQAYTRALTYKDSFDINKEFDRWFSLILSNSIKDFLKSERMSGMTSDTDDELDNVEALAMDTEHDTIRRIKAAIKAKPEPLASALYLAYICQYKPREIKEILDMKNATIRQAIWRFRKEMELLFPETAE